jgi:hypothetical protein
MSSIAQQVIDKYVHGTPVTAAPAAPTQPKKVKSTPSSRAPLTSEELKAKEEIRECLRSGIWKVGFIKVSDGSSAIMECTLDPKYLPSGSTTVNATAPTTGASAAQEDLVHVYATDRLGWRAFVITNVTALEKLHD